MADSRLIESVIRALDIMDLLNTEGYLGITEVAKKLNMEKSTVYRTMNTLRARRYVNQDPSTLKYANSYKLFEMGHTVANITGIPAICLPFMQSLAQQFESTVSLGVREGARVVYVSQIANDGVGNLPITVGQGSALYCTAMGKALLLYMIERDMRLLMAKEPFKRFTDATLSDVDELSHDLAEARKRGYTIDNEEYVKG
ncbi:MAG: IclR family transcriptional regulator, partial [Candidatus Adiutrix sp.]